MEKKRKKIFNEVNIKKQKKENYFTLKDINPVVRFLTISDILISFMGSIFLLGIYRKMRVGYIISKK